MSVSQISLSLGELSQYLSEKQNLSSEFKGINPVVCKFMIMLDEFIILPNLSFLLYGMDNKQIEGKAIA